MTEQDIVNVATKHIAEAKRILDVQHRNNLITQSYLGELTHKKILEEHLKSYEKGMETLKKLRPTEYELYKPLKELVEKEIENYKPKPEPIKPKSTEFKTTTFKKPIKRKRGK